MHVWIRSSSVQAMNATMAKESWSTWGKPFRPDGPSLCRNHDSEIKWIISGLSGDLLFTLPKLTHYKMLSASSCFKRQTQAIPQGNHAPLTHNGQHPTIRHDQTPSLSTSENWRCHKRQVLACRRDLWSQFVPSPATLATESQEETENEAGT